VRDAINAGAIPGPLCQTKAEGGNVIKIFATASIRDGAIRP
jgi:hypothetical protein